jgi:DNA-binding GntR family transcriptional regulator
MGKEAVSLKKFAYNTIKDKIISCVYPPGELLNENLLTAELNISRTPIREALSHLQEEGFVRIMLKKGIMVSNITIADMRQVYQVRVELEPFVVQIAGPQLKQDDLLQFRALFLEQLEDGDMLQRLETDTSFHRYLAMNCNNKYVLQLMNRVLDENKRITIFNRNVERVEHSHDEHLKLVDALLTNDYEFSAKVMRQHIENCRDSAFACFLHRK